MPKATMEEQNEWKLPKDEALPAVLVKVTTKTIKWNDKETGEARERDRWEWEFQITSGTYAGLSAWGETEDRLTTHRDNLVRQWAETLRGGVEFEIGEGIDTDDLLGLQCLIAVDNQVYTRKDGTKSYLCPVIDVFPADALSAIPTERPGEDPPF